MMWPPQYQIKKHKRAKHVKLRAAKSHGLIVTVPYRFNIKEVPDILEKHRAWITKQLEKIETRQCDELPNKIMFTAIDQEWAVHYVESTGRFELIERPARELVLVGNTADKMICKKKLIAWMKIKSKFYLSALLDNISAITQLPYESVKIRDQQTLWGSCTSNKTISLNYKLMFLPRHLVEHVLIHELSHTRYLNHSIRFWNLVARHDPHWRENRKQLRTADNFLPAWL